MNDNHPSFAERIKLLKATAENLRGLAEDLNLGDVSEALHEAAETVMSEVLHMEAAQSRFAARKPFRPKQTASRS